MSHSWRAKSESCLQGEVHDYMIITEKNELIFIKTTPFIDDPVKAELGSCSHRGAGPGDTGAPCSEGFLYSV